MASSTSDMRLSGGHPALDLANTVDSRRGRWGPDFLRSFEDLLVLAERTTLVDDAALSTLRAKASARPERAQAALEQALALREAVYEIFLTEDSGRDAPSGALNIVQALGRKGRTRSQLKRIKGVFAWLVPFDKLDDVACAFAIAAADLLIARNARREVRECKGNNCGWLFLDHSKGGHRLWCSDASCGTRSRIARFRAQAKQP